MKKPVNLSQKEARQLVLASQGFGAARKTNLEIISQLGYIQIDTISVTERSHHHVFHSRNRTYKQQDLNQLMLDKSIFEYWSHAAAFLPIDDFRFSLYQKAQFKNGEKHWFARDPKVEKYVLDRISAEGPLQSKDFDGRGSKKNTWSSWKPAKISLTNLFMEGSLMVTERKGFQKVFDLTKRVLPASSNMTVPSEKAYGTYLIENAIKSQGLVTSEEISYLRKGMKPIVRQLLQEMKENGQLLSANVAKNDNRYFTTSEALSLLDEKANTAGKIHILNPFDNLVIQRKRMKDLFDFDYLIECYVPEQKRVFGYYTLPILYGDKFVARIDGKADRKTNTFIVKNFWPEEGLKTGKGFQEAYDRKLKQFAGFCGCDKIESK